MWELSTSDTHPNLVHLQLKDVVRLSGCSKDVLLSPQISAANFHPKALIEQRLPL